MLSFVAAIKWTEQAVRFMNRTLTLGTRTLSRSSVRRELADALCRHGMLRIEQFHSRTGVVVYSATSLGQKEFSK